MTRTAVALAATVLFLSLGATAQAATVEPSAEPTEIASETPEMIEWPEPATDSPYCPEEDPESCPGPPWDTDVEYVPEPSVEPAVEPSVEASLIPPVTVEAPESNVDASPAPQTTPAAPEPPAAGPSVDRLAQTGPTTKWWAFGVALVLGGASLYAVSRLPER